MRPLKGRTIGPLGPNGVLEQLAKGVVGPHDEVSVTGGGWKPLHLHPDFRAFFFPGEEQLSQSKVERKKERGRWFWYDLRQHSKKVWAVGAAGASLSLAVVSSQQGLLVIPETWIDTVDGWLSSVKDTVQGDSLAPQAGPPGDAPGESLVQSLRSSYPEASEVDSRFIALQKGKALAWEPGSERMEEANVSFEKAVAAAPSDTEALSLLAEAYAKQSHVAVEFIEKSELLLERAAYLNSEAVSSPAYQRAMGWLLLAQGDRQGALDSVSQCGLPVGNAGMGQVDLGCALLVSLLDARLLGMTELGTRYPDIHSVQVVWAQAALDRDELGLAEEIGLQIHQTWPESPWVRQLAWNISLRLGRWEDALALIASVPEPGASVADRAKAAEIALKTNQDPAVGRAAYADLLGADDVDASALTAQVWADAATAAYFNWAEHGEQGDLKWAKSLSDQALKLDEKMAAAYLIQARYLMETGEVDGAIGMLRQVDPGALSLKSRERFTVHAAMILLEAKRPREAMVLIESTLLVQADSHDLYMALALAHLRMPNAHVGPALDAIEKLGFLSKLSRKQIDPLQPIWMPEVDWMPLLNLLESELAGNLEMAERESAAFALLMWATNHPRASEQIEIALNERFPRTSVHAAKAQMAVERGDAASALNHARTASEIDPLMIGIRGWSLCKLGTAKDGEPYFDSIVSAVRDRNAIFTLRLDCLLGAGENEPAMTLIDDWLNVESDNLYARQTRVDLRAQGR